MNTKPLAFVLLILAGISSPLAQADLPQAYDLKILFTDSRGYSAAWDINDSGWVVGTRVNFTVATLWKDGAATNLSPSRFEATAYGINNKGQIAGSLERENAPNSWFHDAVVWNDGNPTRLNLLPTAIHANAYGINDTGQVVGSSQLSSATVPTIWNGTTPTQLITPAGGPFSEQGEARAINNKGQIVGWGGSGRASLWEESGFTDLEPDNVYGGKANSINESGEIVGYRWTYENESLGNPVLVQAAYWNNGSVTNLPTLNEADFYSEAFDINNQGVIVGMSMSRDYGGAVIWEQGQIYDLNIFLDDSLRAEGWYLAEATAINDKGQIVGIIDNRDIPYSGSAFLLTPVPEPETYAMLLAGLGVIAITFLRRKRSLEDCPKYFHNLLVRG